MSKSKTYFTDIYGDITDFEELKRFAQAQFESINELNAKYNSILEENKKLNNRLASETVSSEKQVVTPSFMCEEESIAREQLRRFKNLSDTQELTLEETRKVEIYAKILMALKDKPKKTPSEVEKMDLGQLLKLVEDN